MFSTEKEIIMNSQWQIKVCMWIVWGVIVTCGIKGYVDTALLLGGLFFLALMLSCQLGCHQELTRLKMLVDFFKSTKKVIESLVVTKNISRLFQVNKKIY